MLIIFIENFQDQTDAIYTIFISCERLLYDVIAAKNELVQKGPYNQNCAV
jgi:hypothetical protein